MEDCEFKKICVEAGTVCYLTERKDIEGCWNHELIEIARDCPDPKKYADREELVAELKKKMIWGRYDRQLILDIIRTHGLED